MRRGFYGWNAAKAFAQNVADSEERDHVIMVIDEVFCITSADHIPPGQVDCVAETIHHRPLP